MLNRTLRLIETKEYLTGILGSSQASGEQLQVLPMDCVSRGAMAPPLFEIHLKEVLFGLY